MADQTLEQPLPAIFEYTARIYGAMEEEATLEALGPQYGDEEGLVYEGFLTKLIQDNDLPNPYYTKVTQELKRMDCARQLRRGGSTSKSRWLLLQPPSPELWHNSVGSTPRTGKDAVDQRINDLAKRMSVVEEALGIGVK